MAGHRWIYFGLTLLLLENVQRTTCIDLNPVPTVACSLVVNILTVTLDLDEADVDLRSKVGALMGIDDTGVASNLCLYPFTNFPVITEHDFASSYVATLDIDTTWTFPYDYGIASTTPAKACQISFNGVTEYSFDLMVAIFVKEQTNQDVKLTLMCDSATQTGTVTLTPVTVTPQSITVSNAGISVSLDAYDTTDTLVAPGAVTLGDELYWQVTFTFPATATAGLNVIGVHVHSCYAYDTDPHTTTPSIKKQIVDSNSCPPTVYNAFAVSSGFQGPSVGNGIHSPFITKTGTFFMPRFRTTTTVFVGCTVTPCFNNDDSTCFGPPTCSKRRKRSGNETRSESVVKMYTVNLNKKTIPDYTEIDETEPDTRQYCFQDVPFMIVVSMIFLLVVISTCISIGMCYQIRSRTSLEKHVTVQKDVRPCTIDYEKDIRKRNSRSSSTLDLRPNWDA